jgi:hypothetical protein
MEQFVAPYFGDGKVCRGDRAWRVPHFSLPGWYLWSASPRSAMPLEELDPFSFEAMDTLLFPGLVVKVGYLLGDRMVENNGLGMRKLSHLQKVWYIPPDPLKFQQFNLVLWPSGHWVFRDEAMGFEQDFPVRDIYEQRGTLAEVEAIPGISPVLKRVFLWESEIRDAEEQARKDAEEAERKRIAALAAEERRKAEEEEMKKRMGEFGTAVPIILHSYGAELLRIREIRPNEAEVAFRYRGERMACVIRKDTMQVLDAGICLTDHETGRKHDHRLTLRALIPVVKEAIETHKLVIWRHA